MGLGSDPPHPHKRLVRIFNYFVSFVVYFFLSTTSAVFPLRDIEVVVSHMHTSVVPKASPETLPELATYLDPFAPLFRRSTSRESVERYLTGC